DYKAWAKGLKKAGYATDPAYADRLIKIIEDYQLHLLDTQEELPLYADSKTPVPSANSNSTSASANSSTDEVIAESMPKRDIREKRVFVPSVEVVDAFAARKVKEKNGIKYVVARQGDTYQSLAKELNLGYWQLPKYNEVREDANLTEGQIVYIQPKKKESDKKYYITKPGDTVFSISQEYGIKTKYIYKYNELNEGASLPPGQKILLQKKS
ncbi:MAG: LysM peptidoglycan-binding domain-containing protein, partial [Bacteroidota bacterium]